MKPADRPALDDLLGQAFIAMGSDDIAVAVADESGMWSGRRGANEQPLFWWASAGKTAVAVAVLQMAEDGQLSLEDPVSRWVDGVPLGDRITIRMLLDHSSGLFSANEAEAVRAEPRYRTVEELVAVAAAEGSLFCPGQGWRYSNTNYWLLGAVIERIDGIPMAEALTKRVVDRAGLEDFRIVTPEDPLADTVPARMADSAVGEIEARPGWVGAAGPVLATPEAMIHFLQALLDGRLLDRNTVVSMLAEPSPMFGQPQFYGLGLMAYAPPDRPGTVWIGHSGGAPGVRAAVVWSPTDKAYAAAALTGPGSPEAVANRLLQAAAASR